MSLLLFLLCLFRFVDDHFVFVFTPLSFWLSYALDINMDRVEDVLLHQRLLALAKDPDSRPVFNVRFMEVWLSIS